MKITAGKIPGLLIFEPEVYRDSRGHFMELWQKETYPLPPLVQDNLSVSTRGVLRGLHLQHPHGQGKLVTVLEGEVFDVAVDVRKGSPHFGAYECLILSSENYRQFYMPPGFAHGFYVLSERATFLYKVTAYYSKPSELTVKWNDPDIGIPWPTGEVVLSEKDKVGTPLHAIRPELLPSF